ncbi:MAG: hypothetical protein JJU07_16010, partial [Natronohydrobacter sp.]|nr:hypothetical protein [Natronohydrobacter sp.]
ARRALAEPLGGRVFFAGEAMATPFAALLSGAHLHGTQIAGDVALALEAPGCSSCAARGQNRARSQGAAE